MTTRQAPIRCVERGGESWRDPWADYRTLRDHDPVHYAEHPEFGEFFVLSRFADVIDAARDMESFSSAPGLTLWIVGFVFTKVAGGNDTTTGLLGGATELLTAHGEQRRGLIDDPSLIRPAVDEFLRLTTPVQNFARATTRNVMVADVRYRWDAR